MINKSKKINIMKKGKRLLLIMRHCILDVYKFHFYLFVKHKHEI